MAKKLPHLITCPISNNMKIPQSVSLTTKPCDNAENNLKIINNQPLNGIKKKFGVCVKQITFEERNFAIKFIEWIHLLRFLGNEKVHFYVRYVHPDLNKVLKYLEEKEFIENLLFLEPSGIPDVFDTPEGYSNEMAMLNDCFYRNRNLYEYIVIIDPDEVIVPTNANDMDWQSMVERVLDSSSRDFDSLVFDMVIFPHLEKNQVEGIPEYHYMLQHVKVSLSFIIFAEIT